MPSAATPKSQARRLWTFEEMAAKLVESNSPTELWDGEIVMPPAPTPSHQEIVLNFASLLRAFVRNRKLGRVFVSPIDVVLSQRRAVQPDVIYISTGRLHIIQDVIRGVPELVAEVVSEGSWRRDRVEKKGLYEQFGVTEYWIIDPEAQHSRAEQEQTAGSHLLRGLTVSWTELTA